MSDRQLIKDNQKGVYRVIDGVSSVAEAEDSVEEMHEETFVFDVASDAAVSEIGIALTKACKLKSVQGLAITGLATSGSAYITQTITKRDGAGGAAVDAATFTTNSSGGAAITAFVPYSFTLSATYANTVYAAGNVLGFKSAETSTPTTPIAKIAVTVEYI